MINEIITSILEAEKEADRIVKDANAKARANAAAADEEAKKVNLDANEKVKAERKAKIALASHEADDAYNASIKVAEGEAEALKAKAESNVDKATDFIVGRII